jgi:SAM-dependent methyltransferase
VEDIKEQWAQRQRELGNTTRAVLFKNLPAGINERLHRAHVRFLVDNLPAGARTMLDVGCGYGRTAAAVKLQFPHIEISGVELCEEFAKAFAASIGPCFAGSIAEYETDQQFDAITIVTLLMYLDPPQQRLALAKLWNHLRPGGRMILIEPYLNLLTSLRRKFRVRALAPTGGEVGYFRSADFSTLLSTALPGAIQSGMTHFNMPFAGFPTLHLGAVLQKPIS